MKKEIFIGSSEIPPSLITEAGVKYYVPDSFQTVVYTGRPHIKDTVHVCSLGDGQIFYIDRKRLRRMA